MICRHMPLLISSLLFYSILYSRFSLLFLVELLVQVQNCKDFRFRAFKAVDIGIGIRLSFCWGVVGGGMRLELELL